MMNSQEQMRINHLINLYKAMLHQNGEVIDVCHEEGSFWVWVNVFNNSKWGFLLTPPRVEDQ